MPNKRWMVAIALLLMGGAFGGFADAPKIRYNVDVWPAGRGLNGLPENVVLALTQTRDGYLWLGTLNGLARFDGLQFKVFDQANTPGLDSGLIVNLFEDSRSNLWVGTMMGGVALVKNGTVVPVPLGKGLREGHLAAICEDTNGTVWLYTADGQLARRRKDAKDIDVWRDVPSPYGSHYRTVIAEQSGSVWVGTDAGLWRVDTSTSINGTNTPNGKEIIGLSGGLDFLLASRRGGYWRLAEGRIQKWNASQMESDLGPYPWNRSAFAINAACEDSEGNLVVGTAGNGIWWLDAKGGAAHITSQDGLSHNTIDSLCVDREGSLWVGTDGRGLDRVRRSSFEVMEGTDGKTVQSVSEGASQELWVGFYGGGIVHWKDGTRKEFGDAPNSYVRSVFVDKDRQVWAGTWGPWSPWIYGLFHFENEGFKPTTVQAQVTAIFQDRNGLIWAGSRTGLWQQGKLKPFTKEDGLASDSVQAIAADTDGSLWVGTAAGLNRMRDGKFTVVSNDIANVAEDISGMYVDKDGVLWIGTRGRGLERLYQGKWTHYTTENGLISNSIGYLIEDNEGNLWMGSPAGFMRVSKKTLNDFANGSVAAISCRTYGESDGLPTSECTFGSQPAACRTSDGKLWFPTINGLATVDPAQLKPNTNLPPVVIEAVSVDGRPQITNSIRPILPSVVDVPPGTERLDIQFASLNLAAADRARFKYRMEEAGQQTSWTEVGSATRTAYYPKLQAGNYTFHVIACNEDGIWNETGASLAIIVEPPFWRRWWFIATVSLALLGWIVVVVHYFSTQRLQRQLAGLRQQQALEKERQRIARDIHDQLGASLTQLSMLGEMVESDKDSPGEIEEHGRQISQGARDTAKVLDEIVWAVNPSNDTLDGLITYFCKNAQEYLSVAGLRYRLDVPSQLPATPIPPDVRHNVFMAAKEAVTNIVRHANATSAWIRLRIEPGQFILEIEDNGKGMAGMDPARAQTRNGLSNMRKRLEETGGNCAIGPGAEGGTLVRLTAPLGKDKFDAGAKTV